MKRFLLVVAMSLALACGLAAQEDVRTDSMDLGDVIKSALGVGQPKLGFDAQVGAQVYKYDAGYDRWAPDVNSMFTINLLRVFLFGDVGGKFSYMVQGELNYISLLDLRLSYRIDDNFRIDVGQFKAPFGREFLKNDADLTFMARSNAATYFTLDRQRGIQVVAETDRKRLTVVAGVFNGPEMSYDNKISLLAGRIAYVPVDDREFDSGLRIDLGGSAALTTEDTDLRDLDVLETHKVLYSSNLRIDYDRFWIEGEWEYLGLMDHRWRWADGVCADIGCRVSRRVELAGRFDWVQKHDHAWSGYAYYTVLQIIPNYLLGLNWYPAKNVRLKFDLVRDQYYKDNSAYIVFQYAINHEH